jgi:hypothetical protein
VESALRAVARKIHATQQADPNATGAPIDPDAAEVQQLKSAAMPLLFQLREEARSAHARPPDRPGKGGVADLSSADLIYSHFLMFANDAQCGPMTCRRQ